MQQNRIYKIRRLRLQFKQGCRNIKIAESSSAIFYILGQNGRYSAAAVAASFRSAKWRQIQFWSCQSYLYERPCSLICSNLTIIFQNHNMYLALKILSFDKVLITVWVLNCIYSALCLGKALLNLGPIAHHI